MTWNDFDDDNILVGNNPLGPVSCIIDNVQLYDNCQDQTLMILVHDKVLEIYDDDGDYGDDVVLDDVGVYDVNLLEEYGNAQLED